MSNAFPEILTIGHSVHPIARFLALLQAHGTQSLVDVRAFPSSRRHPQFNQKALARALAESGLEYYHMVSLGGRRKAPEDPEAKSGGRFASYAQYAKIAEFRAALNALEALARHSRVAVMCAEADWRQCHRGLIAAALGQHGFPVTHIMPAGQAAPELPGL